MMFLKKFSVILDILLLVPGVFSGRLGVTITSPPPCVIRGSSVDIGCSYDYPDDQNVTETRWFKDGEFLLRDSEPRQGRFQYTSNKHHDCTLRINNIEDSDMGRYDFMFWTTQSIIAAYNSRTTLPAVSGLTVTLLTGNTVSEWGEVILSCETSCEPRPTIFWFKDGRQIPNSTFPAKIQDAGDYQCAVKGQETWKSAAVSLDVQYGPQDVVLSVSPQGDVVKGSSVTLSCSSSGSKPRIHSYFLLKDNTRVAQKNIVTISNIQPSDSGTYSCQAKNNIATVNSPRVTLNVHYPPENTVVSVNPPGEVVEGSTVTLTCSCYANPPVDIYTWYRDGGSTAISTGPQLVKDNVSRADSGQYTCRGTNKHGSQTSSPHSIDVLYPPVNVLVEVSAPDGAAEGSSVTLTCSSDANPPVDNHNYTWYKSTPGSISPLDQVGSGPVLFLASLQPSHAGLSLFICHTRNSLGGGTGFIVVTNNNHPDTPYFYALIGLSVGISIFLLILGLCLWKKCTDPCCVKPIQPQGTNQGSAGHQQTNQSGSSDDTYCPLRHGNTSVYDVLDRSHHVPMVTRSSRPQRAADALYANARPQRAADAL